MSALLPKSDAYLDALPGWARELYGDPGLDERTTTRRLRALRKVAYLVPRRVRWWVPEPHLPRAIDRLGAAATPTAGPIPVPA